MFHLYFAPSPIFPEEIDNTTRIDNEKKFTSLVLSEVLLHLTQYLICRLLILYASIVLF